MVSFDSLHEKIDAEKKVRFLLAKVVLMPMSSRVSWHRYHYHVNSLTKYTQQKKKRTFVFDSFSDVTIRSNVHV